jgi:hypothetical protein
MQHFKTGDLVLIINSVYNFGIIGHAGTVKLGADHVSGYDKDGCLVSGTFVVVDLPGDRNRYGTTLWYLKPEHLIKIHPRDDTRSELTESRLTIG